MSRRDIIIIATLVNASLLALLFMLAINIEDVESDPQDMASTLSMPAQDIAISATENDAPPLPESHAHDEVDYFIKDLAAEESPKSVYLDDEGYVQFAPAPSNVKSSSSSSSESAKQPETDYVFVTVKKGDALEKIARNNGTTVEAIKKANNLTSAKLSIGQVLRIPVAKKSSAQQPLPTKSKNPSSVTAKDLPSKFSSPEPAQYYTIKSGDNPWKIARQYNVPFEELLRLNNLNEEKARNLKVGDKIRVK